MIAYYFYNFAMYLISRLGLKVFVGVLFLSFPFFLYFLPETGWDFSFYRNAYETVYFDPYSPLLFRSNQPLTAEPGWFLYNGLVRYITSDFRTFLVINFALTVGALIIAFRKFGINDGNVAQILALMIPVQFLIIFFWSPRSALSLGLTFLFVASARKGEFFRGFIFALMAILIHSQYGLIVIFCGLYYGAMFFARRDRHALTEISLPVLGGVSIVVVILALTITMFVSYLDFLPSYEIVSAKTESIFREAEGGFRVTALLSLIVFPAVLLWRWRDLASRPEFDVIVIFSLFSFMVNLLFVGDPHIAGRLARASDYFLFGYMILEFSRAILEEGYAIPVLLALLVTPFLFGDLYGLLMFF